MLILQDILNRKIIKIQRLDTRSDYELDSPNVIVLTLSDSDNKLVISIVNDGISCDIKVMPETDIENEFDFTEQCLNDLRKEDDLSLFINEIIKDVKIAEFIHPEIKGEDFVIKQDKYAGVKIETENHDFLFYNNFGGWIVVDDEVMELPNTDRWQWMN